MRREDSTLWVHDRAELERAENQRDPETSANPAISLRYLDTFAKIEQRWYFAARKLIVDWSETRTLSS